MPLCCQNTEHHTWPYCSKDFKPIQATFLLHRIMRQDRLRACGRTQPANALNPRVSQLLEADVGGNLEKMGRKVKISRDFIILGFWENSFYSILVQPTSLLAATNSKKRRENRQDDRGRQDDREDRRDCRDEEGAAGKDKRDCKQDARKSGNDKDEKDDG